MNTSKDIAKKLATLKQEYIKTARQEFQNGTKELFENNLELKSFGWRQYTPYFADGDTPEFGVNTDEPNINDCDGYEVGYEEGSEKLKPLQDIVAEFLGQFDSDVYLDIFGDHAEVTITADKTVVDEYSHDWAKSQ